MYFQIKPGQNQESWTICKADSPCDDQPPSLRAWGPYRDPSGKRLSLTARAVSNYARTHQSAGQLPYPLARKPFMLMMVVPRTMSPLSPLKTFSDTKPRQAGISCRSSILPDATDAMHLALPLKQPWSKSRHSLRTFDRSKADRHPHRSQAAVMISRRHAWPSQDHLWMGPGWCEAQPCSKKTRCQKNLTTGPRYGQP